MTTLEIIQQIESEKKSKNLAPTYALKHEVISRAMFKEVAEDELLELEKQCKIRIGDTLNRKYIEVL